MKYTEIYEKICKEFNVKLNDALGHSRKKPLPQARQMFAYWLSLNTTYSLVAIADTAYRHKAHHTTIMYSIKKMQKLIDKDFDIRMIWHKVQFNEGTAFTSLQYRPK